MSTLLVVVLLSSCAWLRNVASPAPSTPPPLQAKFAPVPAQPTDSGLGDHWQRGAFMQIDVRAYQDSDGDGTGDLKGLIRRLDHLKELGVRGLLLMPIQPGSGEGRGDAIDDARAVDPAIGTLADMDALIEQAHARQIGVVIDYPLNHASATHPTFVDAKRGSASAYRDWYVWSADAPRGWDVRGRNPWHAVQRESDRGSPERGNLYYGVAGASRPDYNFNHAPVLDHHLDNLRFWLNRGVDGFRLLGVTLLVENDAQRWNDQPESRRIAAVVAQTIKSYPRRFVACDAAADTPAWAEICGAAFTPGFGALITQAARGDASAVQSLAEVLRKADAGEALWMSSLDATAGTARLGDELRGDAAAYRLAAASYLLLPGAPFVHYGEEVGQAASSGTAVAPGGASLALRGPMSWVADNAASADGFSTRGQNAAAMASNVATHHVAVQRQEFGSIYNAYKDLLDMRNRRPSVARGTVEGVFVRGQVLGFVRVQGDERTLVVVNYGARRTEVNVAGLPRRARVAPIYPRRAGASYVAQIVLADGAGRLEVDMPARSARVFDVEPQRRD